MKLAAAAEMAALDRRAAAEHGVPVSALMEAAGEAVAEAAERMLGALRGRRVVVVCGRGNNGGDGLVAARLLGARGALATAWVSGSLEGLRPDAAEALKRSVGSGADVRPLARGASLEPLLAALGDADLVIDALLGTGFEPPVRGPVAGIIEAVNGAGRPVLAVDLPSGLSADRGEVSGAVVSASATVTFGLPKPALVLYPAADRVGRLWLGEIGFPPAALERVVSTLHLSTSEELSPLLAPRPPESHKGRFGHVLVLAGSRGLAGAAHLAARGALRAGAGLVTVALPSSLCPASLPGLPEAMLLPLPDEGTGRAAGLALEAILGSLPGKTALAAGPGLSRDPGTVSLLRGLLQAARIPIVLDADGLEALSREGRPTAGRPAPLVLTPHPGEMGRLLGMPPAEVQRDRLGAARGCADLHEAVTVLKGARTVVAAPGGEAWVNTTGNPAMAAGGMGDVLAGAVAAHLARGIAPLPAATIAVHLHGLAGDLEREVRGPWGILAAEVADRLPAAARVCAEGGRRGPDVTGRLSLLVP